MASAVNPNSKEALIATFNQPRTAQSSTAESVQDRFLTLLVTQMRNQDPLNPMDNAEVTTQLAQISTVSGIDKLNSRWKECRRVCWPRSPCRRAG